MTDVGARWYDPDTGTFASLDPLFEATDTQQQNGYTYVGANPVSNSDPTGLNGCTISDGADCRWSDPTGKVHDGSHVVGASKGYCSRFNCNPSVIPAVNSHTYKSGLAADVAARQAAEAADRAEARRLAIREKIAQSHHHRSWFSRAWHATEDWAIEHADIVGTVAGVVVGLGCTALTGGAGAIACGALGGLFTGLITGALQCAGGDKSHCGTGLLVDAAVGAGLGAIGGAAGALIGGAGAGAAGTFRAGLAATGRGALSGIAKAAGELGPGISASVRAVAPKAVGSFIRGSGRNIAAEYAEKGLRGQVGAITKDLARGAVSSGGLSPGFVGGTFPSTRDDTISFARNGPSFGVSSLINVFGGMLGGGFE